MVSENIENIDLELEFLQDLLQKSLKIVPLYNDYLNLDTKEDVVVFLSKYNFKIIEDVIVTLNPGFITKKSRLHRRWLKFLDIKRLKKFLSLLLKWCNYLKVYLALLSSPPPPLYGFRYNYEIEKDRIKWKKYRKKLEKYRPYPFSEDILIDDINKIKVQIKLKSLDESIWLKVKGICQNKFLDIHRDGLLIHFTSMNWTKDEVEKFIDVGILKPYSTNKYLGYNKSKGGFGASFNPGFVSFFITGFQTDIYETYSDYVGFIIDPFYVKKSDHFIYVVQYNVSHYGGFFEVTRNHSSDNVASLASKVGIKVIDDGIYGCHDIKTFNDEVLSNKSVPFEAIIGLVIDPIYLGRITYLMHKLIDRNPELVFPVYNLSGDLIWPV